MGICKGCGKVASVVEMKDGYCKNCLTEDMITLADEKELRKEQLKNNKNEVNKIMITTETQINIEIEKRIDLISAECIYGINIIKDFFSGIRDMVGGNVKSLEKSLKDAKIKVINDLKEEAYLLGDDAVIAIKIEHTYNNAGGGSIMSIFATGTVVKLKV